MNRPFPDFSSLRQEAVALVQTLSGDTWTDYNLHDPGVTILEALCYALTDLAYRTDFPITDLLADDTGVIHPEANAFFQKSEILVSNPVTVNDYRKVLLDRIPELYNVWLEPVTCGGITESLRGLYQVTVQVRKDLAPGLLTDATLAQSVTESVRKTIVTHRNVCEDVADTILILKPVTIRVKADIEIAAAAVPEGTLSNIYSAIEDALNPPIAYSTEDALIRKGYAVENLYAGPYLSRGFIPDDALLERRRLVDPSEIIKAISQVAGVRYVRRINVEAAELEEPSGAAAPGTLSGPATPGPAATGSGASGPAVPGASSSAPSGAPGAASGEPDKLPMDSFPYFDDSRSASPIRLFRDGYEVQITEAIFNDYHLVKQGTLRRTQTPGAQTPPVLTGVYRHLSSYYSIQHLFPSIYALTETQFPKGTPAAFKGQVKQLKGYLLFFEQVMANYLAQLGQVRRMFSPFIPPNDTTHAYQPLTTVPGIEDLLLQPDRYQASLARYSETPEQYRARKHKILDHLLARFNEEVSNYPALQAEQLYGKAPGAPYSGPSTYSGAAPMAPGGTTPSLVGGAAVPPGAALFTGDAAVPPGAPPSGPAPLAPGEAPAVDEALVWKARLLQGIARTGRDRNKGFDYLGREGGLSSGLGKKVADLLDIKFNRVHNLTAAFHETDIVVRGDATGETGATDDGASHRFLRQKMSFFLTGIQQENYKINPLPGGRFEVVFQPPGEDPGQPLGQYADEAGARRAIQGMVGALQQINLNSEGFHVVEHILLRPPLDSASYGFRFYDLEQRVLLQHLDWMTFDQRSRIITELLQTASSGLSAADGLARWKGKCRMLLDQYKTSGWLVDPGTLSPKDLQDADAAYAHICKTLLQFTARSVQSYPRFNMLVKGPGDQLLEETFLNFTMTIVLPAWPARFQDRNFKNFAENLFRDNTPAHIRLRFLWTNISRMTVFEQLYGKWTDALRNPADADTRNEWAQRLISFLLGNQSRSV
ncbi:hypothetical protein [Dinghuibacter silviterrae]|uniref:Uncharacterized protein n=1 Tax=Dinghuibacter silviterrae TaxID=1539049 RepID=A0A4R8DUY5_9BACT|nr:hypothetical protein [Dinghuibacter silviterrae]TDX01275.1 hypothetical protein EDB95_2308 [Dinghuibacter silviterrae]